MKKTLMILFALCFFFPEGIAFAQQLGNPTRLIEKGAFNVGLQGTWVFKQAFEDFTVNRVFSNGTITTQREENTSFEDDAFAVATVTYGLMDRLNLFAKSGVVGGGSWFFRGPGPAWEAKLKSCFVWGIGAKGTVFQMGDGWEIGLGALYLRNDNRDVHNWKELDTGLTAEALGWNTHDEIDYWQVDVVTSLSWNMGRFAPYVGVGYNYSHIHVTGSWAHSSGTISYDDDGSFSNKNKFTALAGFDVEIGKNFTLNLQGTFVSSTALTLGVSYVF